MNLVYVKNIIALRNKLMSKVKTWDNIHFSLFCLRPSAQHQGVNRVALLVLHFFLNLLNKFLVFK